MNITTISNKNYLADAFHIKQAMQMVELKLNMIIALDKSVNHPLINKNIVIFHQIKTISYPQKTSPNQYSFSI